MKKSKILLLTSLTLLCGVIFAGCGKNEDAACVRYLNFKPEVADVWEEIAQLYEEETGVKVEIYNAPSNCNEMTLQSQIAKRNMPTLFQISGPVGFQTWKNYCADLSGTDLYSWMLDKDMAITGNDGGVYGIPYVVEGYGIIYNDEIMQRYFSLGSRETTYTSMNQINNFEALKAVTEDMTKHKSELGIKGVFASTSFAKGEDWRWQTHLMNLPVYLEYRAKGANDLQELDFSYAEQFKNIFDLYLDNSVIDRSEIAQRTVADSMAEFALGECAMVQNGNWAWPQISGVEGNIVKSENCKYLPIYTGAEGEENQGICTGTECYISVNRLAPEADQKASIDFLEWLFSSDTGKGYVKDRLEFITVFNTFSANEVPENPLAQQVSEYLNDTSKSSVSWNFTTFPGQTFKDKLADHLYLYACGKEPYSMVEDYVVAEWKEEKNALN